VPYRSRQQFILGIDDKFWLFALSFNHQFLSRPKSAGFKCGVNDLKVCQQSMLYSELPVFEGILWAYFEGRGTSDTLHYRGSTRVAQVGLVHVQQFLKGYSFGNVLGVRGWRGESGMMRRHCGHFVPVCAGRGKEQCSSCWAWGWGFR
jgi:hypothetical protein